MGSNLYMPALSPEEILKISEAAVATIAAKKIVTKNSAKKPPTGVIISVRGNGRSIKKRSAAVLRKDAKQAINTESKQLAPSNSSLVSRARSVVGSVLSQRTERQYIQESFNQVRKARKA